MKHLTIRPASVYFICVTIIALLSIHLLPIMAQVECGRSSTSIHTIQGTGAISPKLGDIVAIEGVIVGDFQGRPGLGGFFVQEEDADADSRPTTSEGIFVFDNSMTNPPTSVGEGDVVRVNGEVLEFTGNGSSLTYLWAVDVVPELCSRGASVAATTVNLPLVNAANWERFEGMLVTIPQELTAIDTFNLARYGEVGLAQGGRLFQPTNTTSAGLSALDLQTQNNRRRIILDDGNTQREGLPFQVENSSTRITRYPTPAGLSATNTLRLGDTLNGLIGIVDHRRGSYRIHPRFADRLSFTPANPRPTTPTAVGGTLKVASFNLGNYFNGGETGAFQTGPNGRGAVDEAEFTRQRQKIINTILAMNADIVGLMEVEDDAASPTNESAIENLVEGLNTAAGNTLYQFIPTGIIRDNDTAIRVAIIYKSASVAPVGDFIIDESDITARRPVAQRFRQLSNNAQFTLVVNHLTAKACEADDSERISLGVDQGDGQGCDSVRRLRQAERLLAFIDENILISGSDADVLIVGDMNAYEMEEPIKAVIGGGYTNLVTQFVSNPYSYAFMGLVGQLDHALASSSLTTQVTGATIWHINADEPEALGYEKDSKPADWYTADPYRSSDHDPVIIGLNLSP